MEEEEEEEFADPKLLWPGWLEWNVLAIPNFFLFDPGVIGEVIEAEWLEGEVGSTSEEEGMETGETVVEELEEEEEAAATILAMWWMANSIMDWSSQRTIFARTAGFLCSKDLFRSASSMEEDVVEAFIPRKWFESNIAAEFEFAAFQESFRLSFSVWMVRRMAFQSTEGDPSLPSSQ